MRSRQLRACEQRHDCDDFRKHGAHCSVCMVYGEMVLFSVVSASQTCYEIGVAHEACKLERQASVLDMVHLSWDWEQVTLDPRLVLACTENDV